MIFYLEKAKIIGINNVQKRVIKSILIPINQFNKIDYTNQFRIAHVMPIHSVETNLHNSIHSIAQAEIPAELDQEIGDYVGWTIVLSSWKLAVDAFLELPRVSTTMIKEGVKNTLYATIILLMIIKGFPLLHEDLSEPD